VSALLSVRDLNVYYGGIHALKGMSFDVAQGEVVSLIGANGAGKTTTLRAISGILPYSGDVIFENKKLLAEKPHLIMSRGISHSPEGRGVFGNLTVLENLEMGAYIRSDSHDCASEQNNCPELYRAANNRCWRCRAH
jgi:branched-chain amino acid transport system ATP-binding protein